MNSILGPLLRLIFYAAAFLFILLGLYLKGFFTDARFRKQRIRTGIGLLTGALIIFLMGAATGAMIFPFNGPVGILLQGVLHGGRFLAAWIPDHRAPGSAIVLGLIILSSLLLALSRKKTNLSLVLLLFSFGAALVGGISLGERAFPEIYFFLGLGCLYAWFSGLVDNRLHPPPGGGIGKTTGALLLAAIILLGFILRSYALGEVSYRFDHYESDYGREALAVLSGRHNVGLWTSTIWRGLGHLNYSPIYVYCTAFFFQVFGATILSLKMVSVTWGIIALLLTYGIVSTLFGRRLALLTVFLLALSPLHNNYSRIGLLLSSTLTVSLLVVFLLIRAVTRQRILYYVLLGPAITFAGYFYSPGKYPILLTAALIATYSLCKRGWFIRNLGGIILMILSVILLMAALDIPAWDVMAPRFAGYESVWHRTRDHTFTPQPDYRRAVPLIQENLEKLIQSFFLDRNFNYDPWPRGNLYFNPAIPPLFLLGVAFSLSRIRRPNYRLLLFFAAAFIIPNLLSRPPVMVRRMMVSWPFIFCLAAIPLSQLLKQTGARCPKGVTGAVGGLVIALLLVMGAYNCLIFFENRQPAGRWEEERFFDEYAKSKMDNYFLFIVPANDLSKKTISFLLHEKNKTGAPGYQFLNPVQVRKLKREDIARRLPVAVICAAGTVSPDELARLRDQFGEGRVEEFRDTFNRPRAWTLFIDSLN